MANILVVDDSIVMRKNLASILVKEGHTIVGEASNGRQAIAQYEELLPDIVTMDISMPVMSGVEAVQKIIEKYPEAKIIMISAVNQKKMVFNAINAGAMHYIVKPIDRKKVLSVVDVVLASEEESKEIKEVEEATRPQGFEINNVDGKFEIHFNEHLDQSDNSLLNMAIRGILFIKPLIVIFNFGDIEDIEEDVLLPLLKLSDEIKQNGGEITYVAESVILNGKLPNE